MSLALEPGKYVVAVSGGVDSVVLLQMLLDDKKLELIVAHFDHGIRPDSAEDERFVRGLAKSLGLRYFSEREELGPDASEAEAREHRYEFLRKIMKETGARAIVTAHHQDDLIETAVLNVVRGTKRRGLTSLRSTDEIKRPLIKMSKAEIKKYAQDHNLNWREDSTNTDERYARNRVRAELKRTLTDEKKSEIMDLLEQIERQNNAIDELLEGFLLTQPPGTLPKKELKEFSEPVSREIVAAWLRKNHVGFDSAAIERIVGGLKKLHKGSQIDIQKNFYCEVGRDLIVLKRR